MAQIFLIKNPASFKHKENILVDDSKKLCIAKLLKTCAIEPVRVSYDEKDAKGFIKDYIDLMAQLNHQYSKSLLWWATDLSSKNRYMSQVPDYTQELIEILGFLERHPSQRILIVDPSLVIQSSLHKAMSKLGISFSWNLSQGGVAIDAILKGAKKMGGVFYNAFKYYSKAVYARCYLSKYFSSKLNSTQPYYVIKTFSYHYSWDEQGRYEDAIFGKLPEYLSQKNVFVWTFDSRNFKGLVKQILKNQGPFLMPVEFFFSLKDCVSAVIEILCFRIPIAKEVLFRGIDVSDILKYELARAFNGIQILQYLHYHATKNLISKLKIETFLLTYENNPWERMTTIALQKYSPKTKILGYSHSVIPQASLNMFIAAKEKSIIPLPHQILINGKLPMDLIQNYGEYSQVDVKAACALRYEHLFKSTRLPRSTTKQILVILDGVKQTNEFVNYILKEVKDLSQYQFILRPHPMLPWASLVAYNSYPLKNFPNVVISSRSLSEDLKNVDIVIYWQSTVALEALSLGKPLINFSPDSLLSYDPLYGHSFLKWTVKPGTRLQPILNEIYALSDAEFEVQYEKGKDFLGQYFFAVTPERLSIFGV